MPSPASVVPLPSVPSVLRANLERVRERIARACRASGRAADEVRLLAVTKGVPAEFAVELARAGQLDLGENRVEALERKAELLAAAGIAPSWHLIGHLQRNKARRALRWADVVHSVDSTRLLESLERLAAERGRSLDVFLELKLVALEERTGFEPAALPEAARLAARLPHLRLRGLMTIAEPDPLARAGELATRTLARTCFARLRELGAALPAEHFAAGRVELSMGMSSDLEAAIHEGAHWVRVGSALFEGAQPPEPESEARS